MSTIEVRLSPVRAKQLVPNETLVVFDSVSRQQFSEFVLKRFLAVMLFLIRNIVCDSSDIRVRDRERAVIPTPRKSAAEQLIFIDPVGRAALEELNSFLDGPIRRQVDQSVSMVRIEVVDHHVDPFLRRILFQKT